MTDKIPGLMGFVIRNLKVDRDLSARELYERSLDRYPAVADMTVRQFHARYPLQAKKQLNRRDVRLFPLPKSGTQASGAQDTRSAAPPSESEERPKGLLAAFIREDVGGSDAQGPGGRTTPSEAPTAPAPRASSVGPDSVGPDSVAPSAVTPPAAPAESAGEPEPTPPARAQLRLLLFRLALDMETAPTRSDLVDVISRIDRYVDEALTIVRTAGRKAL